MGNEIKVTKFPGGKNGLHHYRLSWFERALTGTTFLEERPILNPSELRSTTQFSLDDYPVGLSGYIPMEPQVVLNRRAEWLLRLK